jgi:hypothetical protein
MADLFAAVADVGSSVSWHGACCGSEAISVPGMSIDVFWQPCRLPQSVRVPDQGAQSYRGRE